MSSYIRLILQLVLFTFTDRQCCNSCIDGGTLTAAAAVIPFNLTLLTVLLHFVGQTAVSWWYSCPPRCPSCPPRCPSCFSNSCLTICLPSAAWQAIIFHVCNVGTIGAKKRGEVKKRGNLRKQRGENPLHQKINH